LLLRKNPVRSLAIQIVDQANAEQKPVVIESLDFSGKKSSLQKGEQGQARYNAMLSSLSCRLFRQSLTMQCLKQGVALVHVNPAYTSLLGKLKYNRETRPELLSFSVGIYCQAPRQSAPGLRYEIATFGASARHLMCP
jgi:IS605 OrfB family transposase